MKGTVGGMCSTNCNSSLSCSCIAYMYLHLGQLADAFVQSDLQ